MNKLSRQREQEIEMRRQVAPWFEARNYPLVLFDKLKPYDKRLLHKIACIGCEHVSHAQLLELSKDLGIPAEDLGIPAGREGSREPTDEELRKFFRPVDDIPSLWKF